MKRKFDEGIGASLPAGVGNERDGCVRDGCAASRMRRRLRHRRRRRSVGFQAQTPFRLQMPKSHDPLSRLLPRHGAGADAGQLSALDRAHPRRQALPFAAAMRLIWRWRTISIWPSRATTCRLRTPTFCARRRAVRFAASIPASCRARRAAASAALAQARPARERAARRAARAARARALPDWCNRPSAPAPRCPLTIRRSLAHVGIEHQTTPLSNLQLNGVPSLQLNTANVNLQYVAGVPDGHHVHRGFRQQPRRPPTAVFTTCRRR